MSNRILTHFVINDDIKKELADVLKPGAYSGTPVQFPSLLRMCSDNNLTGMDKFTTRVITTSRILEKSKFDDKDGWIAILYVPIESVNASVKIKDGDWVPFVNAIVIEDPAELKVEQDGVVKLLEFKLDFPYAKYTTDPVDTFAKITKTL